MSTVIYNGVKMELVKTNGVERIPIFSSDKTTYLYTQWTHDFVAVLNPSATSYDAAGVAAANQIPLVTDKAIRHKLTQGHATYEWYVGEAGVLADRVIRSPAPAAKTDMNNGPHPEVVSVVQVTGTHTWMIHMRITTWINECPTTPLLLSHRWRMAADYDQDHYATRTVTGEAVFNPVRLAELARTCDDFRNLLRHPVPTHFQRTGIEVVQGEDGVTVNYSFVDTERPMNMQFTNGGITNITVQRSLSYSGPDGIGTVLGNVLGGAIGAAIQAPNPSDVSLMSSRMRMRSRIGARNVGWAAAIGAVQGAASGISGSLPSLALAIRISVTGNRNSRKRNLYLAALEVLVNRIQLIVNVEKHIQISVSFDDTAKSVELTAIYSISALALALNNVGGLFGIWSSGLNPNNVVNITPSTVLERALSTMLISEDIATPTVKVSNSPDLTNPRFPNSVQTRGTWVEKIVAQSLSEPCSAPPSAPSPVEATDLL